MSMAQTRSVTGEVTDKDTKEPLLQTTVQLLRTDSTFVSGTLSDERGLFKLQVPTSGKYLIKFSTVGYHTVFKHIVMVEGHDLALGKVTLGADAIMLKGAEITAQAAKVVVKEDTFIYNSAAYRTPEGSVIEELVRRLPGAEISDDGTITINGKTVKKVMVDGKEFMTGDTKTALKNLPTSIVERIKAYDQKSDLTRVTGIDDGEETTVLDFGLKKGMNRGLFSNLDLSVGTENRYAERGMGAYFNSNNRFMMFANANNVNDMGFGGGRSGRFGGGRQGLNATKMIGANYNYEVKNKINIDASLRWNHNDGDVWSKSSSENFVSKSGAFTNRVNQSYSRSNQWNGQMRLEWQPDTMTNIMLRPSFSISKNDSRSTNISASFNADPYLTVTDPLSEAALNLLAADSLVVNSQRSNSIGYGDNKNLNTTWQLNRRIGNKGRNVTVRGVLGYTKTSNQSLSAHTTRLWLKKTLAGEDSTYQTNRYYQMPGHNMNYSLQTTYSEPLFRGGFLQLRYQFRYQDRKSNREAYDFSDAAYAHFSQLVPSYRGWRNYLSQLSQPLYSYYDKDLSRSSEYKNYIHELNLTFRLIREKYQLNAGIMVQPQRSRYTQDYLGVHADTVRTVTNFSPTLNFRYRFSKQHQLHIDYRGITEQPSMADLLDITDDSNPLNISKGNPGLKPSFTQNLWAEYRNYIERKQRFVMGHIGFSTTRNSISSMVTYDASTGGRTTRPENINGNWSLNGGFTFNTAIDTAGYWNINTNTSLKYDNHVGYLALERNSSSMKNTVQRTVLSERLAGSYRNAWIEVELNGSVDYDHARNALQPRSNLDTWRFSYGGSTNIRLPWGMSLNSDLHMNSRRGYNDASMNTNELIWNAQIAQSFLHGSPLTLSLQFYDLLKEQSNLSRAINAFSRSDTEYNAINSYAMLHVVYRMNIFGTKEMRREMRNNGRRPDFGDPRLRGNGPPDGRRGGRGGFGGPMMTY